MSELVVPALQAVSTAGDAHPPLRSVASSALWIANTVKTNKHAKAEWTAFANYLQQGIACVIVVASKDSAIVSPSLEAHLRALETAVDTISRDVRTRTIAKSLVKRVRSYLKDRSRIRLYTATMDRALSLFNLGSTIAAHSDFVHLLENSSSILATIADIPAEVVKVGHGIVKSIKYHANLDLLPYASGAAWNPQHTGLSGTRTAIMSDIMHFIREPPLSASSAEILLLQGVLGCGKSTIANTISKLCAEAEDITLLSSFFFDKGVPGRDTPALLLSTIAHDLSRVHPAPAEVISASIEQSRSLLSPPLAQQFEHLLVRPAAFLPGVSSRFRQASEISEASSSAASTSPSPNQSRPLVVVIDALDAGYDEDFLRLLAEGVPHLPPCFRFVITTRPSLAVSSILRSPSVPSHIVVRELEIDEQCGEDVALYARNSLDEVREARRLGNEWPGEALEEAFVNQARDGGLFAWVASVSEYLRMRSVNPTKLLAKLVAPTPSSRPLSPSNSLPCLERLNAQYSEVLRHAPWEDEDFETAYRNIFGALTCIRRPMGVKVLDALLGASSVSAGTSALEALVPLAPLLRGLDEYDASLQVLHPSLRDLVLQRRTGNAQFSIDAQRVEEQLALRTLAILNEQLPLIYPSPSPTLSPVPPIAAIAPATAAAAKIALPPSPPPSPPRILTSRALRARTTSDATSIKSTHSQASRVSLSRASITITDPTPFLPSSGSDEAEVLWYASDMWFEHLMTVEEPSQELLDALATFGVRGDHTNSNLTRWIGLCVHHHMNGDESEGESAGRYPAGKLDRLRAWCKRVEFDLWGHTDRAHLGAYLHALASHLHGRRQDQQQGQSQDSETTTGGKTLSTASTSLDAVREAIVLRRELAHDRPSTFNAELATSLQLLSYILATCPRPTDNNGTGSSEQEQRKTEALAAIHEAVTLRRNLAGTWPALYNPVLAGSLHEFALRLGEMGNVQDAEMATQEEMMLASNGMHSAIPAPPVGL